MIFLFSNPIVPSFIISNGCLSNDASVQLNVQGGQSPYTATWVLNLTIQTTTISEINADQYSISPNPNNGSFSILISSDETNEVSIYDVFGRNIQSFKINKNETVEMNLSSGKYFASFISNSLKPYRIQFIVF